MQSQLNARLGLVEYRLAPARIPVTEPRITTVASAGSGRFPSCVAAIQRTDLAREPAHDTRQFDGFSKDTRVHAPHKRTVSAATGQSLLRPLALDVPELDPHEIAPDLGDAISAWNG